MKHCTSSTCVGCQFLFGSLSNEGAFETKFRERRVHRIMGLEDDIRARRAAEANFPFIPDTTVVSGVFFVRSH